MISDVAVLLWGSFTVFTLWGLIGYFYRPHFSDREWKKHMMVIVSAANYGVENSLFEICEHTIKNFKHVHILIDSGADLEGELRSRYGRKVISVPRGMYPHLVGKGRAIHHYVENKVSPTWWYSFIDDDNLVTDKKFLYEITYYNKNGYVACNPILKPRTGKSSVAFIIDTLRYFDDLTIFRYFTGSLKKPLLGLHGELLTAKGSILKEIGFNRRSLTEDFRFAGEIVKKDYNVWQSRTIVSIKSPNSIRDLLKQRGRWFKGISNDIFHVPIKMTIIVGWRLAIWSLGVIGSWAFFLWWPTGANVLLLSLPGGLYYWFVYTYGIYKAKKWYLFPFIPVFGIIESVSFAFGLFNKKFVVIDKN